VRVGAILAQRGLAIGPQTSKAGRRLRALQQAGQPSGKDDEFYHQAKKELQQALDKENQPRPA
jgi:hypothetical protein